MKEKKQHFKNHMGAIATLEYSNGWYYLTIGDNVSQSRDLESRMRILNINGYRRL